MKTGILIFSLALMASPLFAADSKEALTSAAKKLGQESYSWKITREFGNFNNTSEGKAQKDGLICLMLTFGDNTTTAFLKDGKAAVKRPGQEWQSLAEVSAPQDGQGGRGQFLARMLQNYKAPAAEATDLLAKAKEIKKEGDTYAADLTEEGAKSVLTFGRRQPNAPEPRNAKASVKFWLQDGQLSKYELKVQGTVNFNNEDRDVDGTTTVEIKDVGTTKIEVPAEAQKKMS